MMHSWRNCVSVFNRIYPKPGSYGHCVSFRTCSTETESNDLAFANGSSSSTRNRNNRNNDSIRSMIESISTRVVSNILRQKGIRLGARNNDSTLQRSILMGKLYRMVIQSTKTENNETSRLSKKRLMNCSENLTMIIHEYMINMYQYYEQEMKKNLKQQRK